MPSRPPSTRLVHRALPTVVVALTLVLALPPAPLAAQDQELEGCDAFMGFVEREDFPQALEELDWCRDSVEDLHFAKLKEIVSRPVVGFQPGNVTVEGAMGVATVEAAYSGEAGRIRLQITGGSAAGSAASAGLGALADLARSFGARSEGTDQVRVAGLTGQLSPDGDGMQLVLTMEGGMILTVRGPDAETVRAFAEDIVPDLEAYLG